MQSLLTSSLSPISDVPLFGFGGWMEAASKIDVYALGVIIAFAAIVFLLRLAIPKIGAIAWVTAKETLQQPLFLILMLVGLFGLFIFPFLPQPTRKSSRARTAVICMIRFIRTPFAPGLP